MSGAGREDRTLIKRLETSYNSHYTIPANRFEYSNIFVKLSVVIILD